MTKALIINKHGIGDAFDFIDLTEFIKEVEMISCDAVL